jgi:HK97 gp10 family phage protein
MADFISMKMSGLNEIELRLNELPQKVKTKHLRAALAAGAEVIRAEAARLAPHRKPARPGTGWQAFVTDSRIRLRDAIVSKATVGPKSGAIAIVGIDYKKVHHGHLLEFGTRAHDIPVRTRGGKIRIIHMKDTKKQPFMRPAFDNKGDLATQIIVNRLMAAVELEA